MLLLLAEAAIAAVLWWFPEIKKSVRRMGSALMAGLTLGILRDKYWPGARLYDPGKSKKGGVVVVPVDEQEPAEDEGQEFEGEGLISPLAVTTTLSLDADVSEIALHLGVTNFGYTITRDIRLNTVSLTIVTK